MKRAISNVIALVLIIMMTLAISASAFYWIMKIQGQMQGAGDESQDKFSDRVVGELNIVNINYNINTDNVKIVLENSGGRKIEQIGDAGDTLVISSGSFSCSLPFNSSTCDVCPIALDVNEIITMNLLFGGTDCANLEIGTEYSIYFGSSEVHAQTNFVPISKTNVWEKKNPANAPSIRSDHSFANIYRTDKVVLFGGDCSNCAGSPYYQDTWMYDLSEDSWTQKNVTTSPSNRSKHASAMIYDNDKVLMFGGWDGTLNAETWIYDLSDNTWTNMLPGVNPGARRGHSMARIYNTDKVLLFGGEDFVSGNCDGSGSNYCNGTWIYDLSDNTWIQGTTPTSLIARTDHAMTFMSSEDKVLLHGGYGAGIYQDTWVYDLSDDTWTRKLSHGPGPIYEHDMASLYSTDKIVMFCGRYTEQFEGGTWIYDLSDNTWTKKSPINSPSNRDSHSLTEIGDSEQVLFFGGKYIIEDINDTWIYY